MAAQNRASDAAFRKNFDPKFPSQCFTLLRMKGVLIFCPIKKECQRIVMLLAGQNPARFL